MLFEQNSTLFKYKILLVHTFVKVMVETKIVVYWRDGLGLLPLIVKIHGLKEALELHHYANYW